MWRRTIRASFVALIVLSCAAPNRPRPLGDEDYAVYAAVLRAFAKEHAHEGPVRFAVIDSTMSRSAIMPGFQPTAPALWGSVFGQTQALQEAVADFQRLRQHDRPLGKHLPEDFNYVLVRVSEIPGGPGSPAGNPQGVFRFSRVGFSRDRQRAFVFLENYIGPMASSGRYYFLSGRGSAWRVEFNPGGIYMS